MKIKKKKEIKIYLTAIGGERRRTLWLVESWIMNRLMGLRRRRVRNWQKLPRQKLAKNTPKFLERKMIFPPPPILIGARLEDNIVSMALIFFIRSIKNFLVLSIPWFGSRILCSSHQTKQNETNKTQIS